MTNSNGSGHKRGRKRTNVWTIPDLEKRVTTLITDGALNEKDGQAKILKAIMAEFGSKLEVDGLKLSPFALKVRIPQLVWTKKAEGDLWNAISNKMLPKFREAYAYIPEAMVTKKAKSLKGMTHAKSAVVQFKAGMGVLDDDELPRDAGAFEFPHISYHEPLVVSTAKEGQLSIVNGALLGIPYTNIVDSAGATSVSVTNLAGGVTYYFAVTAYNDIGLESDFSNEISYTAPAGGGPATLRITMSSPTGVRLSGSAPSGFQYQVLRSADLKKWTSVGNVTANTSGSFQFTDPFSTNATACYRLQQTSP